MKHSFLILSLSLVIVAGTAHGQKLIDRTLVMVNDEVILESDIDRFLQKIKSKSFQELFGGIDPSVANKRDNIVQLLIDEKIVNQQVKKLELQANDQEVDGQIRAITKRNGITLSQLEERLKQLGTSMKDYRDGIRRQIERNNLIEREIKPSMELTEEQLRHFYMRTAKQDELQSEYKIAHILVSKKPGAPDPQARTKTILAELQNNPTLFEKYAKEYSDDPGSAEAGGVLGYFSLSSLSKEFRTMVPKIPVGQMTPPIKTSAGYHIVKVLDVRSVDFGSLPKERRDALRSQMMSSELEKRMALWLERKRSEAHIKRFN